MKSTRSVLIAAGLLILLSGIFVCWAWVPGRMTGGGSVFRGPTSVDSANLDKDGRVTHGFEIHCGTDLDNGSIHNSLQINWKDAGGSHHFHLDDRLLSADCFWSDAVGSPNPPPALFNTFTGIGTGKIDNVPGGHIYFVFTDAGEPGGTNGAPPADTALYQIRDSNGNLVLD